MTRLLGWSSGTVISASAIAVGGPEPRLGGIDRHRRHPILSIVGLSIVLVIIQQLR
jgi:hypothetical protein